MLQHLHMRDLSQLTTEGVGQEEVLELVGVRGKRLVLHQELSREHQDVPMQYEAQEEHDASDVILGTFTLFNIPVTALIDPGSTHSYICDNIIKEFNVPLEKTSYDIEVSSPLGKSF